MSFPISLPPGFELEVHLPEGFELVDNPASNQVKPPPGYKLERSTQSSPGSSLGNAAGSAAGASSAGFFAPVGATSIAEPAVSPMQAQLRPPRPAPRTSAQVPAGGDEPHLPTNLVRVLPAQSQSQTPATTPPTPDRSAEARRRSDAQIESLRRFGPLGPPVTPEQRRRQHIIDAITKREYDPEWNPSNFTEWPSYREQVAQETAAIAPTRKPLNAREAMERGYPTALDRSLGRGSANPEAQLDPAFHTPIEHLGEQSTFPAYQVWDDANQRYVQFPAGAPRKHVYRGLDINHPEWGVQDIDEHTGLALVPANRDVLGFVNERDLPPAVFERYAQGTEPPGPVHGAMHVGRGLMRLGAEGENQWAAGSEIIGGAAQVFLPSFTKALFLSPMRTVAGLTIGAGAGYLGQKGAEYFGATPEQARFVGDVAFFIPSWLGATSGLRTARLRTPNGDFRVVSVLGGRVRAGTAVTPETITARAQVGDKIVGIEIPRGRPTQAGKHSETAKALADFEQHAANPDIQAPAESQGPDQLTPEIVRGLSRAIQTTPLEARSQLALEAGANMVKWMMARGTFVGPDGNVYTVANIEQARNLANKLIDDVLEETAATPAKPPTVQAEPSESGQSMVPELQSSNAPSPKPHLLAEQDPTRAAVELLQRYDERVGNRPSSKQQVPAKPAGPDYLSPEKIGQFAAGLAGLPEMQRGDAMVQAHQEMTAWMRDRIGKPWMGPDHKLHIVRSPQEAEKLALEFINDQVALHDQRLAEVRTPFPGNVTQPPEHTQALPSAYRELGARHLSQPPAVHGAQEIPKAPGQEPLAQRERLWTQPEKINPAALEQFTPENSITAPQFSPGQQVILRNGEPGTIETFIPNFNQVVVRTDSGFRTIRPADLQIPLTQGTDAVSVGSPGGSLTTQTVSSSGDIFASPVSGGTAVEGIPEVAAVSAANDELISTHELHQSPTQTSEVQPQAQPQVYVGVLRGKNVELQGIGTEEMNYTKRPRDQYRQLRRQFTPVRRKWIKQLANAPEKARGLIDAGLSPTDIQRMRNGRSPVGWEVHHKKPLDDNGTNDWDNLILVKTEPAHRTVTNAHRRLVRDLRPGQRKPLQLPVPMGFIYPPKPGMMKVF